MHTFIIAEAGVNHNGDIGIAKKLVDVAASAGADAIKFQTFKAYESTSVGADKAEYQKITTKKNESQLEMIRKLELPFENFLLLKEYAQKKGIQFASTPDGSESLRFLISIDVPFIKIGSTEVTNIPFLRELAESGKPLILSTGMSSLGEVEKAVNTLKEGGCKDLTLMHCTTAYPTEAEDVNIRAMVTMKKAFGLPVGFSDHTLTKEAAVAAVTLGAKCVEKHITIDNSMPGPDHKASMDPQAFADYVRTIRNTEKVLGDGIKKPSRAELDIMKTVRRSILAGRDIPCGSVITEDMLCYKRPGDGIYPEYANILIGMRVNRNIKAEEKILWSDVK